MQTVGGKAGNQAIVYVVGFGHFLYLWIWSHLVSRYLVFVFVAIYVNQGSNYTRTNNPLTSDNSMKELIQTLSDTPNQWASHSLLKVWNLSASSRMHVCTACPPSGASAYRHQLWLWLWRPARHSRHYAGSHWECKLGFLQILTLLVAFQYLLSDEM